MLPKPFRFHGHQSVRRVYQRGKSVRNALGSLHVFLDEKRASVHVAVVVSKKVDKSAVVRNRIRRRIYEIIRLHPEHSNFRHEMVVTVYQQEAATLPHAELEAEVHDLLKKAHLGAPGTD